MRRILIGLLLAVIGLVGLVLTTCGGLALGFFRDGANSGDREFALWAMGIGLLQLGAVAWYVVRWLIRASRSR